MIRSTRILFALLAGTTFSASTAFAQEAELNLNEGLELALPGPSVEDQLMPQAQAASPTSDAAAEEAGVNSGALHFSLGFDVTNAYYYRGIRQEDSGFIAQPWASVGIDAWEGDDWALGFALSTWNSFHDQATGRPSNDDFSDAWYESDIVIGANLTFKKMTFGLSYSWFTSPSDAWTTIEQADLTVGYDDTEWLGAWAMHPTAVLTLETDGAADGQEEGVYLQLGVAPGFSHEFGKTNIDFSFPVTLGLSLKDYYQDPGTAEDETFGYATVGAKAAVGLPVNDKYGEWTFTVQGTVLLLGDSTKAFNDDDSSEFIFSAGIAIAY